MSLRIRTLVIEKLMTSKALLISLTSDTKKLLVNENRQIVFSFYSFEVSYGL